MLSVLKLHRSSDVWDCFSRPLATGAWQRRLHSRRTEVWSPSTLQIPRPFFIAVCGRMAVFKVTFSCLVSKVELGEHSERGECGSWSPESHEIDWNQFGLRMFFQWFLQPALRYRRRSGCGQVSSCLGPGPPGGQGHRAGPRATTRTRTRGSQASMGRARWICPGDTSSALPPPPQGTAEASSEWHLFFDFLRLWVFENLSFIQFICRRIENSDS